MTDRPPYRDVLVARAAELDAHDNLADNFQAAGIRWAIMQLDSYPTIGAYQLPITEADAKAPLVLTIRSGRPNSGVGAFLDLIVIPPAGVLLIPEELTA